MVGIYKITSPSNRIYIGQSWDINRRKKDHRNSKSNSILSNSIKKYGFENHLFEVVHQLPNDVEQKVLDDYEQLYIDSYRNCGIRLMNVKEAGSNGKWSYQLKEKVSALKQGMGKGRKQSEEWVKKRTYIQKGNKNWLGKKHKEETKIKQSLATLGKPKPKHLAELIAEIGRLQSIKNKKPVIQLTKDSEFIKEWPSAKEAELSGIALARNICAACKGQYHTANGFKWQYKNAI